MRQGSSFASGNLVPFMLQSCPLQGTYPPVIYCIFLGYYSFMDTDIPKFYIKEESENILKMTLFLRAKSWWRASNIGDRLKELLWILLSSQKSLDGLFSPCRYTDFPEGCSRAQNSCLCSIGGKGPGRSEGGGHRPGRSKAGAQTLRLSSLAI